MVICWVYKTVEKKRARALANDPSAEFKLLKENHKKDQLIQFLETELSKSD